MSKLALIGLFLLSMCFPASAGTYGKITVDPNAGGAKTAGDALSGSDIAQKVTYEARRKTVKAILGDLSKMTGVTLKAGYNNDDWQVRDRRMNIFVKDIPLADLMNSIARVMKFTWSKNEKDDGTVSYRLYMDRNTLLGADRDRYVEEERLRKRQADRRERLLAGLDAAAGMSSDQMESLKAQSPYLYSLAKLGWADFLPVLFSEVPAAREAFLSGETLKLQVSSLPQVVQQGYTDVWKKLSEPDVRFFPRNSDEMLSRAKEGSITINFSERSNGYGAEATNAGSVLICMPGWALGYPFVDPDSSLATIQGDAMVKRMEGAQVEAGQYQTQTSTAQAQASESSGIGEPLNQHTADPDLAKKIQLDVKGNAFADVLAALADSTGSSVVSDSFEVTFPGLSFPAGEIDLQTVLSRIESTCRYNWDKHGLSLEFRDRDWFRKRSAQIPDAWLEAWHIALSDNGFVGLRELSQMAMLSPEQFWANILTDEVFGKMRLSGSISPNLDLLRFYASLDRQGQAAVFSEKGLQLNPSIGNPSQPDQALLKQCRSLLLGSEKRLRLIGECSKDGWIFRIVTSSGESTGLQWLNALKPDSSPQVE